MRRTARPSSDRSPVRRRDSRRILRPGVATAMALTVVGASATAGIAAGATGGIAASTSPATAAHHTVGDGSGAAGKVLPARTFSTLIGTALVLDRGGASSGPGASTGPTPAAPYWASPPVLGMTSPLSFWHQPVGGAPLAADSAAEVADLVSHVTDRYGGVAAFNAHDYSTAFVTAAAGTPTVDVAFSDCQGKGYLPTGLEGPDGQFTDVPIPAGALPAAGTDNGLSIYSPSTDQLWELWRVQHSGSTWSACWGGRIDHVSQSQGIFAGGFGETATGIAAAAGMLSLADAKAGVVDHALALEIPSAANDDDVSWPAQRSDGYLPASPHAIPEGTRLRLDPRVDVDTLPGLTPLAREIAHAAQTYGFVVTDQAGAVAVMGQSGAMEQAATGTDPWAAYEKGVPDYAILANFPWSDLQALPKDYGKP